MNTMVVKIQKIHKRAVLPEYAHPGDAGMDLFAVGKTLIPAHSRALVPTGIAAQIPENYVGLIWDKSSVPAKFGVTCMAGVIDSGYRGEIKVVLFNTTAKDFTFAPGDKVAQMLIQPIVSPELKEVKQLKSTSRGAGGFGSTGRSKGSR